MAALIKVKEVVVSKHNYFENVQNRFIVIPFIISYCDFWKEGSISVSKSQLIELGLNEKNFTNDQLFFGAQIKTYCVEYKDSTNNNNIIHFQYQKDAESFLKELKNSINNFYENADAYIKFIN